MQRPFGEVLSAWSQLFPAVLRIAVRRLRSAMRPRSSAVETLEASTATGLLTTRLGFMQPIAVDDRRVGTLSSHDDGGTSTAETAASLAADVGADVALALVETVARAAFARGNHRVAWSVRDDDALLIGALQAAGYGHEGRAAPPPGGDDVWQQWSLLSTEVAA